MIDEFKPDLAAYNEKKLESIARAIANGEDPSNITNAANDLDYGSVDDKPSKEAVDRLVKDVEKQWVSLLKIQLFSLTTTKLSLSLLGFVNAKPVPASAKKSRTISLGSTRRTVSSTKRSLVSTTSIQRKSARTSKEERPCKMYIYFLSFSLPQ